MTSQLMLFQGTGTSSRKLIIDIFGDIYNPAVDAIDIGTGVVKNSKLSWKKADEFFNILRANFDLTQVKAIVIRAMEYEVMKVKDSIAFRRKCKEFCDEHGIFYFVGNDIHLNAIGAITKTYTMVNEGEKVMIVMSKIFDLVFVVKLIRENGAYRYLGSHMLPNIDDIFVATWNFDSKKMIILHNPDANKSTVEKFNEALKEYHPVVLHQKDDEVEKLAIIDKISHLMGERRNIYDIRAACTQAWFEIRLHRTSLISVAPNEVLPFEKSVTIENEISKSLGLYAKFEVIPYELLKEVKLADFKTKKIKITFKLDINLLYEFNVEPIGGIMKPPSFSPKVRVVFYPEAFSVYLQNKNKESILEDFDDSKKIPLYISFAEKKPVIGNAALKILSKKPTFVVYDLVRLASMSTKDFVNPKWKFKVENENEAIMIAMDTAEGERRSSVEFILALFLKHALLLVKNEIGKKMEEIEIEFNGFTENETIKKTVVEAGKLINVKTVFD